MESASVNSDVPQRYGAIPREWAHLPLEELAEDPSSFRQASDLVTFLNLLKFFFGTCLLALPYAFSQGGLWFSVLCAIVVGLTQWWAMQALITLKYELWRRGVRVLSFLDLGRQLGGTWGMLLVNVCILSGQLGTCIGYMAYISTSLGFFWKIDLRWYLLIQVGFFGLLVQIRNLKYLGYLSLFGLVALAYAVGVCVYYAISTWTPPAEVGVARWPGVAIWFSLVVFALNATPVALQFEEAMKTPSSFPRVLLAAYLSTSVIFIVFAVVCYLGFGSAVNSVLGCNLPLNVVTTIMSVVLIVIIITGFNVQIAPVFLCIEPFVTRRVSYVAGELFKTALRFALVALCALCCWLVPQYATITGLAGAVSLTLLGFIIPAILFFVVVGRRQTWWQWLLNSLLLALGVVGGSLATYFTVWSIFVPQPNDGC